MGEVMLFNAKSGPEPPEPPMELSELVGNLEKDMRDVRDRVIRLETRSENFATKADLLQSEKSITRWVWAALLAPFVAQYLPDILKKIVP
jgi:hypothetical protein